MSEAGVCSERPPSGHAVTRLAKAKVKAQQIECLGNRRQLQLCWQLYVDDHQDDLPANESRFGGLTDWAAYVATDRSWLRGNAWADTTETNLRAGVLFAYNGAAAIYKCPGDRSTVRHQGTMPRWRLRMRSGGEAPAKSAAIFSHILCTSGSRPGILTFKFAWASPCMILPTLTSRRRTSEKTSASNATSNRSSLASLLKKTNRTGMNCAGLPRP